MMKSTKLLLFWQTLCTRVAGLSRREWWMVLLAGLVLIYGAAHALLMQPAQQKKQALLNETQQAQTQISEIRRQLALLAQSPVVNIETLQHRQLAELAQSIQTQKQTLSSLQNGWVSPDSMPTMLQGLLRTHAAVTLVGMKTLAPENLLKPLDAPASSGNPTATDAPPAVIYKHSVEITLTGHYLDLLEYCDALHKLPMRTLWSKAELRTTHYPHNELTLTLYTISMDKTWLSL